MHCKLSKFLMSLMFPTFRLPPTKFGFVPSDRKRFLDEREYCKPRWILKYLKRRLVVFFIGRCLGLLTEKAKISDDEILVLWINWAAPSLGDSLMDLSARVLLESKRLVLLTHPKNRLLYDQDAHFENVFDDPWKLREIYKRDRFDLVLVDSFAPRVLRQKLIAAPFTPYIGLYGFLNGFEVHRTLYAFARMRELLNMPFDIDGPKLKPSLSIKDLSPVEQDKKFDLVIAVGGEWRFRTYDYWRDVVSDFRRKDYSIALIGSANGVAEAQALENDFVGVTNLVGRTTLLEAIDTLMKSKMFVGADGGLWHLAVSLDLPSVVLFADCNLFGEGDVRVNRETPDCNAISIYAPKAVSEIAPAKVILAIEQLASSNINQ